MMKPLKPTFFIAIAVILSVLPQSAQACSGSACSSFSVENKNYSSSDKKFHATLVNKDQSKKIRLKGCMNVTGKCPSVLWDVTIDPGKRETVVNGLDPFTKPEDAAKNFVVEITSAEFLPQVAAPTPPSTPAKAADIKISVINGESEPLLATLWDVDSNSVIADTTLRNAAPFAVTLNNKGGKGHLRWAVSTIRAGQSTSFIRFIPWDGASPYAVDAYVVYGGKYYRAIKASQHVMPPNVEYWEGLPDPTRPSPGAKAARCGEGDGNFATGEKVILKASHAC
jgi:hypothetical protein